ncbi:MAG: PfkB family carbohydrate kinase [Bacteroidota bacterium]
MNKILIVGDVMLDHYIEGITEKISPEAPVPIVNVGSQFYRLGGAANVAKNISNIGNACILSGLVGDDSEGTILRQLLTEDQIEHSFIIPDGDFVTTTKTRIISSKQQLLRLDKETILRQNNQRFNQQVAGLIDQHQIDIVLISDYAKGVCSDEMVKSLVQYQPKIKVLIDPKGNDWEKYRGAYLVKPNLKELCVIVGKKIDNTDEEVVKYARQVVSQFDFDYLLVTRGMHGMTLVSEHGVFHQKTEAVRVFDVSGAGDTVLSVLSVMLNKDHGLEESVRAANKAGQIVVSYPYTYAINQEEFENILSTQSAEKHGLVE